MYITRRLQTDITRFNYLVYGNVALIVLTKPEILLVESLIFRRLLVDFRDVLNFDDSLLSISSKFPRAVNLRVANAAPYNYLDMELYDRVNTILIILIHRLRCSFAKSSTYPENFGSFIGYPSKITHVVCR